MTTISAYKSIGLELGLVQTDDDSGLLQLYDRDEFVGLVTMTDIKDKLV